MSRIEEALAKLQAARQSGARPGAAATVGRLAEVVHTGGPHPYGGKSIEINMAELHRQRLLAPDNQERRLADEYRLVKRPLLGNASHDRVPPVPKGNVIMIASALSGEGKTFTCINLCFSIAMEQDWEVVLVDGDCNKPHLTRLFGAEHEPGLIDLLKDPSLKFDDAVMPTNIPGLALLPAGRRDENASELLASARMSALLAEAAAVDQHRVLVFDSPPLLLTTEASVLATQVGQIVLVVQANKTPQRAVIAARDKLDQSKAINVILNQAEGGEVLGGYGYYDGEARQ